MPFYTMGEVETNGLFTIVCDICKKKVRHGDNNRYFHWLNCPYTNVWTVKELTHS